MSIIAAVTLCMLSVQAAGAATRGRGTTVSVLGATSYEYVKSCSNTAPYPCGTYDQQLVFTIYTTNQGSAPITVGYQTVDGSAVAASDYQATSGTVTIQQNSPQAYVWVTIVNDGVAEPTETMQLKLTSSSSPASISSVGTGTILDGGQVPTDCTLGKTAANQLSMTCTNRPAGQTWYLDADCIGPWTDGELVGNQVTGNGTSSGSCSFGNPGTAYFQTV
jgi:hypothetical protein